MGNKKNILLTFDYELSLGHRSGTVKNCMIEPTKLILKLLHKHQFKAIFFIDTTCIAAMKKQSKKFPELLLEIETIKEQVIEIAKEGHYVYHHIHPHWVDAKYIPLEKQWDLSDMTNYALNNFNENEINQFFKESKEILEDWLLPINPLYKAEGFRAGGLFIQPFEKLKSAFIHNDIKFDFSVMFGGECDIDVVKYNYLNHPKETIYNFSSDILIPEINGEFKEYAIEMIENKGIYKIINGIWFRMFKQEAPFADGKSIINNINKTNRKIKFANKETFSFELINPAKNFLLFNQISKRNYIHFLSHPKHISKSNIKYTYKLFDKLIQKYTLVTDFKKF